MMILPDNKPDSMLIYCDWLEDNQQEELAIEIRGGLLELINSYDCREDRVVGSHCVGIGHMNGVGIANGVGGCCCFNTLTRCIGGISSIGCVGTYLFENVGDFVGGGYMRPPNCLA